MFGMNFVLKKVEAAGIVGDLLIWFRSYLTDRCQRVVIPGAESVWKFIRSSSFYSWSSSFYQ